jgi:hypothetical protein
VGCHEVLGFEGAQVIESVEQYSRIAILLPPDSKYVEERGPHQVVNGHVEVRKPKGD